MSRQLDVSLQQTGVDAFDESTSRTRRKRRIPRSLLVGCGAVLLLVLIAIVGPLAAPYNPVNGTGGVTLGPPSRAHLMGTDLYGRDIFTRVLYGARIALGLAVACVAVALALGTLCGLVAGFFGGIVETLLMRAVDIVISFPYVVLVITLLAVLGPGLFTVFVAIAVVDATLDISQVILLISALNFLGLGAQPPTPDWGYMVNEGRTFIYTQWWISTFPGIAVMLTGLAFSLLGDGLADALELPR